MYILLFISNKIADKGIIKTEFKYTFLHKNTKNILKRVPSLTKFGDI